MRVLSAQSLGLCLAVGAAFLFSTKPILIKWLYSHGMSSMPLMGMRMLLALPIYIAIGFYACSKLADQPKLNEITKAAIVGLLGYYLASFFDLWGLEFISAQLERIVLYSYPTFVIIFSAIFFGTKVRLPIIFAILLTYFGVALMFGQDMQIAYEHQNQDKAIFGTALILLSAISFALYVLLSKGLIEKLGGLFFTCVSMTSASLATFIHYLISEGLQLPVMTAPSWVGIIVLVVFVTVLPTFMLSSAIKQIGPEKVGISGTLGPLMTTLMAVVLLNEPLGWMAVVGMAFVIGGVSLLRK